MLIGHFWEGEKKSYTKVQATQRHFIFDHLIIFLFCMIQYAPKWNLIHNEHIKIHILISNMEKISLCVGVLGWNFFGLVSQIAFFLKSAFVHQAVLIDQECSLMFKNGCKKAILSPIFDKKLETPQFNNKTSKSHVLQEHHLGVTNKVFKSYISLVKTTEK